MTEKEKEKEQPKPAPEPEKPKEEKPFVDLDQLEEEQEYIDDYNK